MEILAIIGVIVVFALFYIGGGIIGWILKGVEGIMNFLLEGNRSCWGCLFKIIIAVIALIVCLGVLGV